LHCPSPQTPSRFSIIYICMVGLGVLGTLLHCFFYYCICMVLRGELGLTDRRHGNIAQVDSESISSFHSIPPALLRCSAVQESKQAFSDSAGLPHLLPPAHDRPCISTVNNGLSSAHVKSHPLLIASRLFTFIPE